MSKNNTGEQLSLVQIIYTTPSQSPDYVLLKNDTISMLFAGIMEQDGQAIHFDENTNGVAIVGKLVSGEEGPQGMIYRTMDSLYPNTVNNLGTFASRISAMRVVMTNVVSDEHGYIEKI